jgi:hypothetical protein
MNAARRITATMALVPLLVAACATAPPEPEPARPVPTALEITVTGAVEPVLGADGTGRVALVREGSAEPIDLEFRNGALVVRDLPPGQYSIAALGPLNCHGLSFAVDRSPRALGALRADIVATDYYVAMMSRRSAAGADIAAFAERTRLPPGQIDATPIVQIDAAPCFINRGGQGETWRERPLGEQIMFGILVGGFCAAAVAAGGLCAF